MRLRDAPPAADPPTVPASASASFAPSGRDTVCIDGQRLDLPGLERLAWGLLAVGAGSARQPLHQGVFSGLDDSGHPCSRHMVLRDTDAPRRLLAAHTDRRAPKVAQLARDPRSTWVFYDPVRRLQLRLAGDTTVHAGPLDAVARAQWATLGLGARRAYCAPFAAGTVCPEPTSGTPDWFLPRNFDHARADAGFAHFGVLLTHVRELEILHLHHDGHHRARVRYPAGAAADAVPQRDWLTP